MNKRSTQTILVLYLLFIVGILVNFRLLLSEIINWHDDELFLTLYSISAGTAPVSDHDGIASLMMRFLSVQYSIGGNGYFIYHAVSVLLHTVNAMLLFLLLRRFEAGMFLAMGTALLFAVHPLHIASVALISFQATVLSGTLLLCLALVYRRSLEGTGHGRELVAVVIAALVAALSGPSLLPLLVIWGIRSSGRRDHTIRAYAPFFIVWVMSFITRVWDGGALVYVWSLFSESVMMLRNGMFLQSVRMLLPWTMTLIPPSAVSLTLDNGPVGMVPVFVLIAAVAAAFTVRHRMPRYLFALLCIVLPALPIITGIPRGEWLFGDDASYLSVIGWSVLLFTLPEMFLERVGGEKGRARAVYAVTALSLVAVSVPTLTRSPLWFNGGTFWGRVIQEFPDQSDPAIKKGMFHYFRYETEQAVQAMDAAAQAAPASFEPYYHRGLVNLGAMFLPQATVDFTKALAIDPTASNAWFGMGSIHMLYSRYDSAIAAYSQAIRYSPGSVEAYVNRGTVYGSTGDFVRAFADFRKAEQLNPGFAQVYGNRALIALQAGNATLAAREFAAEIRLEPRNVTARIHAALTAVLLSDTSAALLQFSNAAAIDSLRTNLYLGGAMSTFLHSHREKALGTLVTEQVFGKKE